MIITLQFPLFDTRYLRPEVERITRPDWDSPSVEDKVRYMGQVLGRNTDVKGPYDSEKKYCSASKVINFCGTGPDHFYPQYYQKSNIIFRRLQSDGKCLAYFQVGIFDPIDEVAQDHQALIDQIKSFLKMKVKIRIGNKLTDFVPLAACGSYLKEAYYWSTTKGKKTFNRKEIKYQVEESDPLMLVEYNDHIKLPVDEFKKVENKAINKQGYQLQYSVLKLIMPPQPSKNISAWFLGHQLTQATEKKEFKDYSTAHRQLRINLLRVHAESFIMKRVGDFVQNPREQKNLANPEVQELLALLLVKQFENISKVRRFNYQQDEILGLVYSDEPGQPYTSGLENLILESERSYQWLKNIKANDTTQPHVEIVKEYYRHIKKNIDTTSPEIYFSYAWNDDGEKSSGREKIVDELYESLAKNNYKIKRDKIDSSYGSFISDFMDKIGKSHLVVVFLSDKYLRSPYCMFELYEAYRHSEMDQLLFKNKIILIRAEEVHFGQLPAFEQYWEQKKSDTSYTEVEQDRISDIQHHFTDLFHILKDLNSMTKDILKQHDFEFVRKTIDERLGL